MGTKLGLLKCRSVRRKPLGEKWSRRETLDARVRGVILMWRWTLEFQFRWKRDDVTRFRQPDLLHNMTVKNVCYVVKECTRKHSESELADPTQTELLDVLHARLLEQANLTSASAKHFKMSGTRVDAGRQRRR